MKKCLFLISAIIFLTYPVKSPHVFAKYAAYPIKSLGNCQNSQDCYFYCQIPAHTPACWAYGEYVLKPDVLGEQTTALNITFPFAELGNCADPQDCFSYCDKPENQDACFAFAKKNKLLKETDANLPPPSDILNRAKTELGCDSRESCRSFCAIPANSSKCLEFARNNKLLDTHKEQEIEELETRKSRMMEDARKELGCNSMESCSAYCSLSQNSQKCAELAQKHNDEDEDLSPRQDAKPQNTKPCVSDEECQKYCQSHPGECPGLVNDDINEHKNTSSFGDFIGPTGCKTEGECQSYCQKHPKECPNFPTSPTQNISGQKNPPPTGEDQKQQFTPPPIKDSGSNYEKNKFK